MELLAHDDNLATVFEQLRAGWVGCDWPTKFGARGLNLCGVTARQAALVARATSGQESADWAAAARWLRTVESDADAAREVATLALHEAASGNVEHALTHAEKACEIERRHRPAPTWQSLCDALQQRLTSES